VSETACLDNLSAIGTIATAIDSERYQRDGTLRWNSQAGVTYVVEQCLDLAIDQWTQVGSVTAHGTLTEFEPDPMPARSFFRVRVQ